MADGTLRGAFELSADQPIRQLHGIRDAGREADSALGNLGGTMDRLVSPIAMQRLESFGSKMSSTATKAEETSGRVGVAWDNTTRKMSDQIGVIESRLDDLDAKLDRFGSKSVDATVGLDGVAEANAQLSELEARLDRLDRRNATARVGLSGGGGGLFSNATPVGGGGSSTPSSLFQAVGGIPTIALAALGLSPGVMGLLGGATALAGSAGAAGLGAGAVGIGAAGTLGVGGLTAFAGIRSGVTELKNLTAAQSAYTKAVQQYGAASTQAATAQQKLRQEEVANAQALPMFRQLTALKTEATQALAPARSQFYSYGSQVLYNLRAGVPTFGQAATTSTGALGRAANTYSGFLTQQPQLSTLTTLANAFAQDMPLIERSVQNITSTMEHLAVAATPFFHEGLQWVAGWTGGMAQATSNTAKVQTTMQGLVTSTKDWGRLIGSAGTLLKDIFTAGAPTGNSMVTSLTKTLDSWDTWINQNPAKVEDFFHKAESTTSSIARGVGQIAGDFAKLGQMLGPIFDRALGLAHILLSLGPGGAALLGGGLYGGLRGLRGAGIAAPSAGSLATSYLFGSPTAAMRSSQRTTAMPVPLLPYGGAPPPESLPPGAPAPYERVGPATPIESASPMLPPGSPAGEAFYAAYGGVAGARYTSAAPLLAAERESGSILGGLRSASATAGTVLKSLGGGIRTFAMGAARVIAPLAAFQFAMGGLSTQPGVPGSDSGGGFQGFWLRALHGFGIGSGYTSPTTTGHTAAQQMINNLPPGANPVTALLGLLTNYGTARGGTYNMNTGRTMTPAQFYQQHPQEEATLTSLGTAAMQALGQAASQVTTPGGALQIKQQVAQVRLSLPPAEQQRFSSELQHITDTAFTAAGTSAAGRWETALQTGLGSKKPMAAVQTVLTGMTEQLKHLGPQGATAMAKSMGQWAQSMEEQNPKLIKPIEALMNGVVDRMNRMNHNVGTSWSDMQGKIFWFNGQILKGTSSTWSHIGHALTDPLTVAQEKALGIFAQIQKEAINALTQMGISPAAARQLVTFAASHPIAGSAAIQGASIAQGISNTQAAANSAAQSPGSVIVHATGGVFGGTGLLDTVRMPDGSMAAPGEAWIANRHTMADLSRATVPMYGKTAWQMIQGESRTHSMPMGIGKGKRAMTGGGGPGAGQVIQDPGVNMSVGQEPTILSDLYKLSAELSNAVYVISGYRSPAHSVAVGGFANDPHTKGEAADIGIGSPSRDSMFNVQESQLRAVGLYRPFYPASAAEVNHVQLLAGGASGTPSGGGARGTTHNISLKAPRSNMLAVPGVLLDAASTMYAGGLSKSINSRLGALGGIGGTTAGLSGNVTSVVDQLSRRFGWGPAEISDWMQVINRESGGSLTATNPSSGAYGIAQFINGPSEYAQYGGNSTTVAGQLLAMANYIKQRYGDPAGAWAHEQSSGWYARGGQAKWGGWHKYGVDTVVDGPTVFGAGERGRERVRISPTSDSTRGRGGRGSITVIMENVQLTAQEKDIKAIGERVADEIAKQLDGGGAEHDLAGVG